MTSRIERVIALLVSATIHIAILLITFPIPVITITPSKSTLQVPIKFVLEAASEPLAEATPPQPPIPPLPNQDKEVTAPAKLPTKPMPPSSTPAVVTPNPTAEAKPGPATPNSLPGDRKGAVVARSTVPIYPKSALNQGLTGTVVADFAIDPAGKPTRHRIITSSGHEMLDNAFVQTVMTYYTFEPKRVMGENLPGSIRLSYSFELEDGL